ncbi:integrase [Luteibacter sp. HA06]
MHPVNPTLSDTPNPLPSATGVQHANATSQGLAVAAPRYTVQGPNGWTFEVNSIDEQLQAVMALSQMASMGIPSLMPNAPPPFPAPGGHQPFAYAQPVMTPGMHATLAAAQTTMAGHGIGMDIHHGAYQYDDDGELEGFAPSAHRTKHARFGPGRFQKDERVADSSRRLVTELMDEYLAQLPSSGMLNAKGQYECGFALQLYLKVTGDKPLIGVTRLDAQRFVRMAEKWPKNHTKYRAYNGLTADQVIETADLLAAKRLSPVTVNNKVAYVRGFFEYMRLTNALRYNPFDSVALPAPVAQFVKLPFSTQDLQAIFDPAHLKRFLAPQGYWLPVLAHFTGGRLREIAQLRVEDVETITGIPVVHFAERHELQQIKNESSNRVVPLHDDLLKLGFLEYVEMIRSMGHEWLFPGMPWFHKNAGFLMGKRLNETYYNKVCKLGAGKTFHCHRHHFIDQAAKSGLPDPYIARLTGHALDNQSIMRTNYIQASTLAERHQHLMSIPLAPVSIPPYDHAQFQPYFVQLERNSRLVANHKAARPLRVMTSPPRKGSVGPVDDSGEGHVEE